MWHDFSLRGHANSRIHPYADLPGHVERMALLLFSCFRSAKWIPLILPRGSHHEAQLPNWTTSDWSFGESPGWSDGILQSVLSTSPMWRDQCRVHRKSGDGHVYIHLYPCVQVTHKVPSAFEVGLRSHLDLTGQCFFQLWVLFWTKLRVLSFIFDSLKFMSLCWLCGQEQIETNLFYPGTDWLSPPISTPLSRAKLTHSSTESKLLCKCSHIPFYHVYLESPLEAWWTRGWEPVSHVDDLNAGSKLTRAGWSFKSLSTNLEIYLSLGWPWLFRS